MRAGPPPLPLTPAQRRIGGFLILGGLCWMAFWVWVQEHWATRTLGPLFIYPLIQLPLIILPGFAWVVRAAEGRRGTRLLLVLTAAVLSIALLPLLRLTGIIPPP